ncbi:hypothetical protein ABNX05_18505 [Lysinibacillus sp. M3]|uniref:Uncharacterized protein n=1 Tax=Lysinibacillus zambalensis TaxID=3160866 RepID=A0ABV1MXJ4_9BACI
MEMKAMSNYKGDNKRLKDPSKNQITINIGNTDIHVEQRAEES